MALRVLREAGELDPDDPAVLALRRATSGFFKAAKAERRRAHRRTVAAADRAVVELTGTGSASRIDDETAGLPLTSTAPGASAGRLLVPRACYVCKQKYVDVDAFYHQLCPACSVVGHAKREARTDLTGPPGAAHRRAGEDRDVHRAAAAARRCRPHDHHPVPARRRAPLRRAARQRRLAAPAAGGRHRPARPRPGDRARRRRPWPRAARHPHQQRRPDGPAQPGRLRAAGQGRAGAAAEGAAARARRPRAGELRPRRRPAPGCPGGLGRRRTPCWRPRASPAPGSPSSR